MILFKNGDDTYNVSQICYKPFTEVRVETIEGRNYAGQYKSPNVYVLECTKDFKDFIFKKPFIEITQTNSNGQIIKTVCENPNLISITENKIVFECRNWTEKYIDN